MSVIEDLGALRSTTRTPIRPVNPAAGEVDAKVAGLRTAVADADAVLMRPRAQRQHPGRAEERDRLVVAAVREPAPSKGKPVGVGAAPGQYAGTWSRTETRKSVGIAGGQVSQKRSRSASIRPSSREGVSAPEVVEQVVGA